MYKLILLLFIVCLPALSFGQNIEPQEQAKQLAITALTAQIDALQKQINALTSKEANARNRKNVTRAEVNKEKKEVESAEKEYKDALVSLRANPQSQTSRRTVDITQQHLEEVNTNYNNRESQAKTAEDLWKTADNELRKEKAHLEELRELMRKLNSNIVSPEEVLAQIPARFIPIIQPQPIHPQPAAESNYDEEHDNIQTKSDETISADIEETSRIIPTHKIDTTINNCRNVNGKNICDTTFFITSVSATVEKKRDDSRYFVFSVRPEFAVGLVKNTVTAIGVSVELGMIKPKGYYFTGDLSGGALYYAGGGVNIGYCFNKGGIVKIAAGGSAGLYFTQLNAEFVKNGEKAVSAKGKNISGGGIFTKLMGGKTKNLDITYKLLFGYNKHPITYDELSGEVIYDEGFGARHSFGLGYTLTKAKKQESEGKRKDEKY